MALLNELPEEETDEDIDSMPLDVVPGAALAASHQGSERSAVTRSAFVVTNEEFCADDAQELLADPRPSVTAAAVASSCVTQAGQDATLGKAQQELLADLAPNKTQVDSVRQVLPSCASDEADDNAQSLFTNSSLAASASAPAEGALHPTSPSVAQTCWMYEDALAEDAEDLVADPALSPTTPEATPAPAAVPVCPGVPRVPFTDPGDCSGNESSSSSSCSSSHFAWQPTEQVAANLQHLAGDEVPEALMEILRWRDRRAREAAEARAAESGGLFDFDDLPAVEAPVVSNANPREPLTVPRNLETHEAKLRFVDQAVQKAIEDENREKTARQQIQDALSLELKVLTVGDPRRRKLRKKAAEDLALAPADPPPTRHELKELGRLLCILSKEHPLKKHGTQRGKDGKLIQPPPNVTILEPEAIELVKKKADVHLRIGDLKRFPLHKAAEVCYPNLVKELIKARADANAADFAGETALHVTARSGGWCGAPNTDRMLAIENLVTGRANPNFGNPRGRTPLHLAASAGDSVALQTLLDKAADVNAADLGGFTPLMWAAGHGRPAELEALLDARADPRLHANRGQTAMLFALTNKHNRVAGILEDHVALLNKEGQRHLASMGEAGQECGTVALQAAQDKWPKQTLHFPYMGKVRREFVPDLSSNAY